MISIWDKLGKSWTYIYIYVYTYIYMYIIYIYTYTHICIHICNVYTVYIYIRSYEIKGNPMKIWLIGSSRSILLGLPDGDVTAMACSPSWRASPPLWRQRDDLGSGQQMEPLGRFWRETWGLFVITIWLFNIAMENGPFIDGLPIKNGDFPWLC